MALFGFLKKKDELPLPPPPSPPQLPPLLKGDLDEITPAMPEHEDFPQFPPALPAPEWTPEFETAKEEEVRFSFPEPTPGEMQVFDKTITQEEPIVETVRPSTKPAFVAVEDYKRIINDTNIIRSKLMDAETFVKRLGDLKNEEERSFERWRTQLEDVEKKLNYVDQLIARAER